MKNTSAAQEGCLVQRMKEEAERLGGDFELPLLLDLECALSLVGSLQLALRHPQNSGPSASIARRTIDGIVSRMREAGCEAWAELAEMGNDPRYDV